MATANFYNQKNFNLYIKAFESISLEEYQAEYFEDSCYYDDYNFGITISMKIFSTDMTDLKTLWKN